MANEIKYEEILKKYISNNDITKGIPHEISDEQWKEATEMGYVKVMTDSMKQAVAEAIPIILEDAARKIMTIQNPQGMPALILGMENELQTKLGVL